MATVACTLALGGCGGYDVSSGDGQPAEDELVLDFTSGREPNAHESFGYAPGFSVITTFLEGDGSRRWARELQIHGSIEKCMAAEGYSYPPIAFTRQDLVDEFAQPFLMPLSEADANVEGYGGVRQGPMSTATPRPPDTSPGFADAELICGRPAIEGAFADYDAYSEVRKSLESMRNEFATAFWTSDPVRELDKAWSGCMEARGYRYDSTQNARAAGATSAPVEEIRLATADATCRSEFSYDSQLERLFEAADANFAIDNSSLILELSEAAAVPATSEVGG